MKYINCHCLCFKHLEKIEIIEINDKNKPKFIDSQYLFLVTRLYATMLCLAIMPKLITSTELIWKNF